MFVPEKCLAWSDPDLFHQGPHPTYLQDHTCTSRKGNRGAPNPTKVGERSAATIGLAAYLPLLSEEVCKDSVSFFNDEAYNRSATGVWDGFRA
jgi:hypothetical protein